MSRGRERGTLHGSASVHGNVHANDIFFRPFRTLTTFFWGGELLAILLWGIFSGTKLKRNTRIHFSKSTRGGLQPRELQAQAQTETSVAATTTTRKTGGTTYKAPHTPSTIKNQISRVHPSSSLPRREGPSAAAHRGTP